MHNSNVWIITLLANVAGHTTTFISFTLQSYNIFEIAALGTCVVEVLDLYTTVYIM